VILKIAFGALAGALPLILEASGPPARCGGSLPWIRHTSRSRSMNDWLGPRRQVQVGPGSESPPPPSTMQSFMHVEELSRSHAVDVRRQGCCAPPLYSLARLDILSSREPETVWLQLGLLGTGGQVKVLVADPAC
jgi:hypothetical protein